MNVVANGSKGGIRYQIGEWVADPAEGSLVQSGMTRKLAARTMSVLVYFAERASKTVTHEELLQVFWPRSRDAVNAVHKCIAELRRALGDARRNSAYLETVPKRGYRLVAPTRLIESTERSQTNHLPSVAVLRFINVGENPENEYLAFGIAETLLDALARLPHINVASRTNAFQFDSMSSRVEDVGAALGVDHVLEGSVQHDQGRLRVVIQLIRVRDGYHLFSIKLDRSLYDIFQVQDEVASEVVKHLKIHIDERERQRMLDWGTLNVDAYLLTLRGLYLTTQWNQLNLRSAIEKFDGAIALDGSFVSAYVGAARAIRTMHSYVSHTEMEALRTKIGHYRSRAVQHGATPKQLHWIDYTALLLDSRGHAVLEANLRSRIKSGDAGPEDMLRYAVLLGGGGLFEEAYDYFARARASSELAWVELDEVSVKVAQRGLRWSIAARQDLLTRHPEQLGHLTAMAISLAKLGEFDEAITYLHRAQARDTAGKWSFSAESALDVLSGEAPLGSKAFEQLLNDPRGSNFGRGQLCFIAGDVSRGCAYWRRLVGSGLTAATYHHLMAAHYFAAGVVEHSDYQNMLDQIRIGKRWTAFLRECVKELAPVTGTALRPLPESLAKESKS